MTEYKITKKVTEKRLREILDIKEREGLTAEAVLERARKKDNPLHDIFEWDNSKAAAQWRLQQARVFINEVKIIIDSKEYYAFENISLEVNEKEEKVEQYREGRSYFSRQEIMDNEQMRKKIVRRAYNAILYWRDMYQSYQEFEPVVLEINKLEKSMQEEQQKAVV